MIHLPLKQTEKVDLQRGLYKFVEIAYSPEQADEHREAFSEVSVLRERVRQAQLAEQTVAETVSLLHRYYRLLTAMRTRFGSAAVTRKRCSPTGISSRVVTSPV